MELPKIGICNKENLQLLKRYEMIMRNRGITEESIKAICKTDIPLFLRFINPKSLKEITNIEVEDFLFYCQSDRKNKPQSLNRKYTSLNSFFKQLIKKEYLDVKNPLDKIEKAKERVKMREPLQMKEVEKIFSFLEENNDLRDSAIFALFLASGVRLTELWQLNKDSLDYDNLQFNVIGKGQKPRTCIFDNFAKEKILKYLKSRNDDLEPLFISRENQRLSKRAIQRTVHDVCKKCGISGDVFPHRLRHTAGHTARERGVKIEDIAIYLGHENSNLTSKIYARGDITKLHTLFQNMYEQY